MMDQLQWDEDEILDNNIVDFSDSGGTEIIINLNNISMIELPLLEVENVICEELEDTMF